MDKYEYTVVETGKSIKEFEKEVMDKLNSGWECQGGVCVAFGEYRSFYQAMIRKKK